MPRIEDIRYSKYPFIVAKYWSDSDEVLLRVYIHSDELLEMLVGALRLTGDPDTHRSQNGLQLLASSGDILLYLESKQAEAHPETRNGMAELELFVHGFLENWTLFSGLGLENLFTDEELALLGYTENCCLHQELQEISHAFHKSCENSAEDGDQDQTDTDHPLHPIVSASDTNP